MKITDGDTITVLKGETEVKIRLESIDAPERKQPYGTKSKNVLGKLVHEKVVDIYETSKDRYGRTLAFIKVDGKDVCLEMVKQGFAWNYVKYSKSDELAKAEKEAREAKRGLWAGTRAR